MSFIELMLIIYNYTAQEDSSFLVHVSEDFDICTIIVFQLHYQINIFHEKYHALLC
jgi:hypothetical protein